DFGTELVRREQGGSPGLANRVSIVGGIGLDAGGEDAFADGVDADVRAGDVRLELHRTPPDTFQPIEVLLVESVHHRPLATDRLVDERAVCVTELEYLARIIGDQRCRDVEPVVTNELRLERLGEVRS